MGQTEELSEALLNKDTFISKRMRAVFYLRTMFDNSKEGSLVNILCNCLNLKGDSVLLRHEVAYVLGQMQSPLALPCLTDILKDESDDPIVRHEAAEAIGAIGDTDCLPLLLQFVDDARPEVSETCKIAVDRLKWLLDNKDSLSADTTAPSDATSENAYNSVDPAPPEATQKKDIKTLQSKLLDENLGLFDRYKAMFSLRNEGSDAAILALCEGLNDNSALFRHEVAYVLGQVANAVSFEALKRKLVDREEHSMVRHEAAEALGAIGTAECIQLLKEYQADPSPVVSESCDVALDVCDYWNNFDEGVAAAAAS